MFSGGYFSGQWLLENETWHKYLTVKFYSTFYNVSIHLARSESVDVNCTPQILYKRQKENSYAWVGYRQKLISKNEKYSTWKLNGWYDWPKKYHRNKKNHRHS